MLDVERSVFREVNMNTLARTELGAEERRGGQRARRSVAEKRRIVEETLLAGASVAAVARAHGVNANQVFNWRRLYQRGLLGGSSGDTTLVPVMVSDRPATPDTVAAGSIQLRLPKGQLRIEGSVDAASLRVILECLLG